jgi:hypothetical protein
MSVDPGLEVRRAIALLRSSTMVMGNRDKAFDMLTKQALQHLESARAGLGVGPAPEPAAAGLEASIVEWLFGAADAGLATAEAMDETNSEPSKAEVLAAALLSIREWAARLLQKPAAGGSSAPGGIATPGGLR